MSKLDLDEKISLTVSRREAAVLLVSLSLTTGRMPGGADGGMETIAEHLCNKLQATAAPIGVVTRVLDEAWK